MRVAMRGKGDVNAGVEFFGSSCADSRLERSSDAFEFDEAAHGARVDLKECRGFLRRGLECVLHDAVSQVEGVSAGHGLV